MVYSWGVFPGHWLTICRSKSPGPQCELPLILSAFTDSGRDCIVESLQGLVFLSRQPVAELCSCDFTTFLWHMWCCKYVYACATTKKSVHLAHIVHTVELHSIVEHKMFWPLGLPGQTLSARCQSSVSVRLCSYRKQLIASDSLTCNEISTLVGSSLLPFSLSELQLLFWCASWTWMCI
jgi:hypothetical protein